MNIASFDVDPQKGFSELCPEELPVPGAMHIVPALNQMALRAQVRVVSKDAHPGNARWVVGSHQHMGRPLNLPNADVTWVKHCVPGTPGFELLDGLPAALEYDYVVYKGLERDVHPYGACYHDLAEQRSTGVIEFLRLKQVGAVILGGLALDYCVKVTARQLAQAGFVVWLYLPACRGISPDNGPLAVAELKALGVLVCEDMPALDQGINRWRESTLRTDG